MSARPVELPSLPSAEHAAERRIFWPGLSGLSPLNSIRMVDTVRLGRNCSSSA